MTLGPDGHLYIAAHVSEGGDYLRPTPRDTGGVLRQRLTPAGAFDGATEAFAGYPRTTDGRCNRPSDPAFCQHGALHVSSFHRDGGRADGGAGGGTLPPPCGTRRIYKYMCVSAPHAGGGVAAPDPTRGGAASPPLPSTPPPQPAPSSSPPPALPPPPRAALPPLRVAPAFVG